MNTQTPYPATVRAGIIGATGYAGIELAALVEGHGEISLEALASTSGVGRTLGSYYPQLKGVLANRFLISLDEFLERELDLVFLAVPHTTALEIAALLLARGVRVIDLSADYRLKNPDLYYTFYGVIHSHPELLDAAVYGLSELNRAEISQATFVANPGCYPTAVSLACAPALRSGIVKPNLPLTVSAVSGYSGAGRKACESHHYSLSDETVFPYKPLVHQHTPEIEQTLTRVNNNIPVSVAFVPQIASFKRGILANCFMQLSETVSNDEVQSIMENAYLNENFVRVLPRDIMPSVADVVGSNQVRIGWHYDEHTRVLYVASVIDNLVKGAAGQALQNANIMFGFEDSEGLHSIGKVV